MSGCDRAGRVVFFPLLRPGSAVVQAAEGAHRLAILSARQANPGADVHALKEAQTGVGLERDPKVASWAAGRT